MNMYSFFSESFNLPHSLASAVFILLNWRLCYILCIGFNELKLSACKWTSGDKEFVLVAI